MYDAAVIGGGPAGCSAALVLRRQFPRLRVLLIEAGDYSTSRLGEVLPATTAPLLRRIGAWGTFCRAGFPESPATAFRWGGEEPSETHQIYSPWGAGWHLDRRRFDGLLAALADRVGVRVLRNTRLADTARVGTYWRLSLDGGEQVQARFVIDAAGRGAVFARRQGARIEAVDRLTGFARYCSCGHQGAQTLVDSAQHGWWYSARVPQGRIVAFMTDSDIGRELGLTEAHTWAELLAESDWMRAQTGDLLEAQPRTRQAVSARLCPIAGEGWLAAGDAAASVDPLAACGILRALRGGIMAAYAAGQLLLDGSRAGIERYAALHQAEFSAYLRSRQRFYAREQRWSQERFWQRRQKEGQ